MGKLTDTRTDPVTHRPADPTHRPTDPPTHRSTDRQRGRQCRARQAGSAGSRRVSRSVCRARPISSFRSRPAELSSCCTRPWRARPPLQRCDAVDTPTTSANDIWHFAVSESLYQVVCRQHPARRLALPHCRVFALVATETIVPAEPIEVAVIRSNLS